MITGTQQSATIIGVTAEPNVGKEEMRIANQYRAHLLAEQNGLEAWSVSGATRPILVPTYWVREWMALAEYELHTIFR